MSLNLLFVMAAVGVAARSVIVPIQLGNREVIVSMALEYADKQPLEKWDKVKSAFPIDNALGVKSKGMKSVPKVSDFALIEKHLEYWLKYEASKGPLKPLIVPINSKKAFMKFYQFVSENTFEALANINAKEFNMFLRTADYLYMRGETLARFTSNIAVKMFTGESTPETMGIIHNFKYITNHSLFWGIFDSFFRHTRSEARIKGDEVYICAAHKSNSENYGRLFGANDGFATIKRLIVMTDMAGVYGETVDWQRMKAIAYFLAKFNITSLCIESKAKLSLDDISKLANTIRWLKGSLSISMLCLPNNLCPTDAPVKDLIVSLSSSLKDLRFYILNLVGWEFVVEVLKACSDLKAFHLYGEFYQHNRHYEKSYLNSNYGSEIQWQGEYMNIQPLYESEIHLPTILSHLPPSLESLCLENFVLNGNCVNILKPLINLKVLRVICRHVEGVRFNMNELFKNIPNPSGLKEIWLASELHLDNKFAAYIAQFKNLEVLSLQSFIAPVDFINTLLPGIKQIKELSISAVEINDSIAKSFKIFENLEKLSLLAQNTKNSSLLVLLSSLPTAAKMTELKIKAMCLFDAALGKVFMRFRNLQTLLVYPTGYMFLKDDFIVPLFNYLPNPSSLINVVLKVQDLSLGGAAVIKRCTNLKSFIVNWDGPDNEALIYIMDFFARQNSLEMLVLNINNAHADVWLARAFQGCTNLESIKIGYSLLNDEFLRALIPSIANTVRSLSFRAGTLSQSTIELIKECKRLASIKTGIANRDEEILVFLD